MGWGTVLGGAGGCYERRGGVRGLYIEKVLAASLRAGQVVLMDNLLKLTGPRGSGS
jgi:hypothetical protein